MSITCTELLKDYVGNLESNFQVEPQDAGCLITTPFLRPDGDQVELLLEQRPDGKIYLTDMGDTMAYLQLCGLSLSRKLISDAKRIGGRFGASINVNEVAVLTDETGVAEAIHDLIQAAMSIAALVEKRRPYVNLRFDDEVEATIIGQGKIYDSQFQVNGAKEPHVVKYHINSGLNMLIQPFSQVSEGPARNTAERWYYRFDDILHANPTWSIYALLDDRGNRRQVWADPRVTLPLQGLVNIIKWSDKEDFINVLTAHDARESYH
ncbi:MAG: DUF1828 domain-containing protein [Chloroflexi bacterium]|nr:DUF1828 domain-containing protein [Chloroflexota bacterium]MDA1228088.1 DUF1828 domain-containing protein [Chloroflexota bacterium]